MTIKEIRISGLYGYIDKHIYFRDDINLLVGINGSGKTSILNLLNWMLTPSLQKLCVTEFRTASVKLVHDGATYVLTFLKTGKRAVYRVTRRRPRKKSFKPLTISLMAQIRGYEEDNRQALEKLYDGLSPTTAEVDTWLFLKELPKPMILGLDRTMTTRRGGPVEEPVSPIEALRDLANTNYSIYRNQIIDFNNELKDKIMLSAFNVANLGAEKGVGNVAAPTNPKQIEDWKDRIIRYIHQSPESKGVRREDLIAAMKKYFARLTKRGKAKSLTVEELGLLSIEFQRLQHLVSQLEQFETKSEKAYTNVKAFLDTTNGFFKDSSKRVLFKKDTNKICFQVLDHNDQPVDGLRDVLLLSSGERQLLTLFTFIKFGVGGVFVIDEPELSLHPKWQQEFLNGLKTLMPPKAQLIMATHSPALVGKNVNYCIPLLPYGERSHAKS